MDYCGRLNKLKEKLAAGKKLPYFVSDLINIQYLTGFRGSNGFLILFEDTIYFISDSRYEEYARSILPAGVRFVLQNKDALQAIKRILAQKRARRLYLEEHRVMLSLFIQMRAALEGIKVLPGGDTVNELRMVKEDEEIDLLRTAVKKTDYCLSHILSIVRPGITEWDVSVEIEHFYRKNGCRKSSFDSIVASGTNSSMPHHATSMKDKLGNGALLIDMGCEYEGYNSDLTRTVFINSIDNSIRKIYGIVKSAQEKAISSIRPGVSAGSIDKAARTYIASHGYGHAFGHSLGHGVGLEIHEFPTLRAGGPTRLEKNMVVTVEPGIYVPELGGVRIEDVVRVTEGGFEILTGSPKEICIL